MCIEILGEMIKLENDREDRFNEWLIDCLDSFLLKIYCIEWLKNANKINIRTKILQA